MKYLIWILFSAVLSNAAVAQSWTLLDVGTNENLRKVFFTNDNEGFIVGSDGLILKTSDGGDNWESVNTPVGHDLLTITFANEEVGYTNGLKTTDGGETWVPQASSVIYGFMYAYSEERIMAGHGDSFDGQVYESNDGGVSWETTFSFGNLTMYNDCDFVNEEEGYMSSWYGGFLFRTVDGGANWNQLPIDQVDGETWNSDDYRSVDFPSQEIGLVTHQNGILKTNDSGETWSEIKPDGLPLHYYPESVIALSDDDYIMVGKATSSDILDLRIYVTSDGGETWEGSAETTESIIDVACGASHCFAVGTNGTVYRSDNVVNSLSESIREAVVSVFPNPANDILNIYSDSVIGQVRIYEVNGRLVKTIKDGRKMVELSNLESGVYFIKVVSKEGELFFSRFMKE